MMKSPGLRKADSAKRLIPRTKPAKGSAEAPSTYETSSPIKRERVTYPIDVLSPESNLEYLRGMADLFTVRADEVEKALAERKRSAPPNRKARKPW
jgi:hypothetical protein